MALFTEERDLFAIFDSPGCFLLLKGFHEKYFLRKQALFIKTAVSYTHLFYVEDGKFIEKSKDEL